MARGSGGAFVAVALVAGLALAAAGNLVLAYLLDQPINWILSGVTTVLVGGFVALAILGRRKGKDGEGQPQATGFDVQRRGGFEVRERRLR